MINKGYLGQTTLEVIYNSICNKHGIRNLTIREYSCPSNHNRDNPANGDNTFQISTKETLSNNQLLAERIKSLDAGRGLGIESKVKGDFGVKHIPMMDFSCEKSNENLASIESLWKKYLTYKFGHGVIIETDNSYHFIGVEKLLTSSKFTEFLSWSLLCTTKNDNTFVNYIDPHYVAYTLLKKSACLRFTTYTGTNFVPHVVLEI